MHAGRPRYWITLRLRDDDARSVTTLDEICRLPARREQRTTNGDDEQRRAHDVRVLHALVHQQQCLSRRQP